MWVPESVMLSSIGILESKMVTSIVIDDDTDIVEVFCEYLEIKNIQVVGRGHNGQEAVELYQKHTPDVVFLDVMMPGFDGIYALENIRKINPDAKVIVITADLREETALRLNELKPNRIFVKPCDLEKISQAASSFS